MKRLLSAHVVGVIALLLAVSSAAFAEGVASKQYTWQDKFERGFVNIISSPIEIAYAIHTTTVEESLLKGWTVGLVKGFGYGFVRFGTGVVDLVTCPFDFPKDDKSPLIEPEYVWQRPGVKYKE